MKGLGTWTSKVVLPVGPGTGYLCSQAVPAFRVVLFMVCMGREMCFHGSKCLPGVLKTLSLKVLRTVFTTLFHFSKFNGISCPPWILKGFYPFRFMNEKRLNNFPSMLDALAKTLLLKNVVVIFFKLRR